MPLVSGHGIRILIAGFPHSGTSILRKLVGNHPDVHDHFASETRRYSRDDRLLRRLLPRRYSGRRHVVFKWPFHDVETATNAHRVIYIVRSPFDAFGSLWQRFDGTLPADHSPAAWQRYARFLLHRPSSKRHCFVRYEDLYRDDYQAMRSLMVVPPCSRRPAMSARHGRRHGDCARVPSAAGRRQSESAHSVTRCARDVLVPGEAQPVPDSLPVELVARCEAPGAGDDQDVGVLADITGKGAIGRSHAHDALGRPVEHRGT